MQRANGERCTRGTSRSLWNKNNRRRNNRQQLTRLEQPLATAVLMDCQNNRSLGTADPVQWSKRACACQNRRCGAVQASKKLLETEL